MKIGTKSILFGVHQFALHPWFVAWGWFKLYGFRRVLAGQRIVMKETRLPDGARGPTQRDVYTSLYDPRLWVAFFVHDLGYFGKPNMDGPEGELHPELGARVMRRLFGEPWGEFVLYHSRFVARRHGRKPSALCIADKLAILVPPRWLYLRLARATGEIHEYMAKSARNNETGEKYAFANISSTNEEEWYRDACDYTRRWVDEHKDGRADTWTPAPASRGAA
jgi:hypothetical protein